MSKKKFLLSMHQRNFSLRKESTFRPLKWLLRTSKEIPYWWRVTTQFWLVVPWVKFASTNQKHYPDLVSDAYGVSTLVSQTTFREETSDDVARGRLFSQAKELFLLTKSSVRNCVRPFMLTDMKCLTSLIKYLLTSVTWLCRALRCTTH